MDRIKENGLSLLIPTQDSKRYKKDLRRMLEIIIIRSIKQPDQFGTGEGYEAALLLIPIWLELKPQKRIMDLLTEILSNRFSNLEEKVQKITSVLETEQELRELATARKKRNR